MHPLAKWFLPIGIGLIILGFLWWLFQPFAHYLGQFWPQIAIAIGIGLLLWRFPLNQAEKIWAFFTIQPIRGILTAATLTALYGGTLWLGYIYLPSLLISELGISQRTVWLLITIVGLPAIPAIWRLYAITGIPGDPVAISRNFRVLAFLALVFFGWWFHSQPNILFDFKTGKTLFYVADSEEKIYFSSGSSPATGEKLRLGTAEDAKRFAKKSWLYHLERWWSTPPRHARFRKARAAQTFLKREIREVQLQPGIWTCLVVPPPGTRKFFFQGSEDTIVRFADGTQGPIIKDFGCSQKWAKGFKFFNATAADKVVVIFDKV